MTISAFAPRSVSGLSVLVDWAALAGMTPRQCLAGTGLPVEALAAPETEISGEQELRAIANVLAGVGNRPGLGLEVAARYPVTAYGVWGFALISSRTLREAIGVGLRFIRLTYALCDFEAREHGGEISLLVDASAVPADQRGFVLERDAGAVAVLAREIVGAPLRPERVAFALPDPGGAAGPFDELFGTTTEFDAPMTVFTYRAEELDRPLPQASPHTARLAEEHCRTLLQQREARAGRAGQVRDLLLADPAHPPSPREVADRLGTSTRTLRRQLEAEGTSLRGLVNEVRHHLAVELLRGGLTAEQVSNRLGYSEVSNFSHAFRRWTGQGPRAYLAGARSTLDPR